MTFYLNSIDLRRHHHGGAVGPAMIYASRPARSPSARIAATVALLASICSAIAAPAADCSAPATAASPSGVREQAQRLEAVRQLFNDADAKARLSALSSALASCVPAECEIAFEAGFARADETARACAR